MQTTYAPRHAHLVATCLVALGLAAGGCGGGSASSVELSGNKSSEHSVDAGAGGAGDRNDGTDDRGEGAMGDRSADAGSAGDVGLGTDAAPSSDATGSTPDASNDSGPPPQPGSMYAPGSAGGASSSPSFEARLRVGPTRTKRATSSNYRISLQPPTP